MSDEHDDDADIPLEALREAVESRDKSEIDSFIQEDIPDIDPEVVWEEIEADEPPEQEFDEATIKVIPKEVYCQRCEYFSTPPEVACAHEGTTIIDLVDPEHVRVENCPVIARDEELGQVREAPPRR